MGKPKVTKTRRGRAKRPRCKTPGCTRRTSSALHKRCGACSRAIVQLGASRVAAFVTSEAKRETKPFVYSDAPTKARPVPPSERRCASSKMWTAERGSPRCVLERDHAGDHVAPTGETWARMPYETKPAGITPVVRGPQLEAAVVAASSPPARITGNTDSKSTAEFFGSARNPTMPHPALSGLSAYERRTREAGYQAVVSVKFPADTLDALDQVSKARPSRPGRSKLIKEAVAMYLEHHRREGLLVRRAS